MTINKYTAEHIAFVEKSYKTMNLAEITEAFNARFDVVVTVKKIRGITRNRKMLSGRTGCFKEGGVSWNKGTKGLMKANKTSFKKGHKTDNKASIGTERLTSIDKYIKVKVAQPNVWELKHRLLWENANGAIPPGQCVVFKDGDRTNCSIDNLDLIDRGTLAQYNKQQGSSYPPELRTPIRTLAAIKCTQNRRLRAEADQQ